MQPLNHFRKAGDESLLVSFYEGKVPSQYESEKQQKEVFLPADYIRIAVPGDKHTIIDTLVTPEYMERFRPEYDNWKHSQGNDSMNGTPLSAWDKMNPYQVAELKIMNIQTVEQIAGLSDAQVQRIGMGGYQTRDAARKFVGYTGNDSDAVKALAEQNKSLQEQIEQLKAMVMGDTPKRGRPAKAEPAEA